MELSSNESEPSQRTGARSVFGQSGRARTCVGSYQHILDGSATGDHQSDRSTQIMTQLSEKFGNFRRENLVNGDTPSIEAIQCGELGASEACDVSMNLWNRSIPLFTT